MSQGGIAIFPLRDHLCRWCGETFHNRSAQADSCERLECQRKAREHRREEARKRSREQYAAKKAAK